MSPSTATPPTRARAFVDLCRGPHVPSTGAPRCVQAHEGRRRLLARRREATDVAARLRDGVGVEEGSGGAPPPARGGRAQRPPAPGRRARSVLLPRGDRLRAGRLPPERGDGATADGGLLTSAPRGGRIRVRLLTAHLEVEPLRDVRPPAVVRRRHVPADEARRGLRLLPEADELPVPHAHLREPDALLSGAAAAVLRVRDGVPVREVGGGPRTDARARDDPGRRPHLLHEGADARPAAGAAPLRARPPS